VYTTRYIEAGAHSATRHVGWSSLNAHETLCQSIEERATGPKRLGHGTPSHRTVLGIVNGAETRRLVQRQQARCPRHDAPHTHTHTHTQLTTRKVLPPSGSCSTLRRRYWFQASTAAGAPVEQGQPSWPTRRPANNFHKRLERLTRTQERVATSEWHIGMERVGSGQRDSSRQR